MGKPSNIITPDLPGKTIEQAATDRAIETMKKLAIEEQKRYEEIAEKLQEVLIKNSVLVEEWPKITQILAKKIDKKFEKTTIEKVLKL